jgi:hypothetical protein
VLRLPNPPEVFEGRRSELRWLLERVDRAPLSIVHGPPGVGKTALVSQTLTGRREASYVSGRSGLANVTQALGVTFSGSGRPEAFASRGLVVLDDLDAIEAEIREALLVAAARFGSDFRLVALSRVRPIDPDLADRTLCLKPLPASDIERIVARCAPHLSAVLRTHLVAGAHGFPARARKLSLSGGSEAGRELVEPLDERERGLLGALAALERPITVAGSDALHSLEQRGLVVRDATEVVVADDLAQLIRAELWHDTASHDLSRASCEADALELALASGKASGTLEALRLALVLDRPDRALEILSNHLDHLLTAGLGEEVFALLSSRANARQFDLARLRCGWAHLGGTAHRWALDQPAPHDDADLVVWAGSRAHGGFPDEAAEALRRRLERAAPPVSAALRARMCLLLAEVERCRGEPERALTVLEGLVPTRATEAVDGALRRIAALAALGRYSEAAAHLDALEPAIEDLRPEERESLRPQMLTTLLACARFSALDRVLGPLQARPGASAHELFAVVAVALERGRRPALDSLLSVVAPLAESSSALRFVTAHADARMAAATGPDAAALERARATARHEQICVVPELAAYAWADAEQLAMVLDPAAPSEPPPALGARPPHALETLVDVVRAHRAIRRGASASIPDTRSAPPDVHLVALRVRAEAALLAGDLVGAEDAVAAARVLAVELGMELERAEVAALEVCSTLVTGRVVEVCTARPYLRHHDADARLGRLSHLGEQLGSPRFAAEARLGRWMLDDRRTTAQLIALTEEPSAPVTVRRARAIAGHDVPLDALDRLVVAAHRARLGDASVLRLDLQRRAVRHPDGAIVDLSRSVQPLAILGHLVRHGGRASKEALVRDVWSQSTYHPLRDDKRLQVAVHRLRVLLERDPKTPRIVVLDGDGYRLGVAVELGAVT